jgi:serine phosphatase RsbU (regulator of sigma subunit)
MVWGFLRAFDFRRGLRELIAALNRTVVSTFHMEKYLTGFFMVYEPGTERMVCADMGHSHMFFMRGNRVVPIRERKLNLPVGIEYDIDPSLIAIRLKRDDALFVYSDGIVEQENSEGLEYGEERLGRFLLENQKRGGQLKFSLPVDIDKYRGSVPQQDDMSFLLFRFNGAPTPGAGSGTQP